MRLLFLFTTFLAKLNMLHTLLLPHLSYVLIFMLFIVRNVYN